MEEKINSVGPGPCSTPMIERTLQNRRVVLILIV